MARPATTAISPCFTVSDVDRTIAFYREKLGFEVTFLAPDRNPFFAIILRDGAQIFMKSQGGVAPLPNSRRHPHLRLDAFVYSPDPDALAAEFAGHGAAFSAPLKDTHDGLRGFEITDPDGYVLFFGCPIHEVREGASAEVSRGLADSSKREPPKCMMAESCSGGAGHESEAEC
jgi:catechol 2,3-dioxygenase-like lactoylglutathione lyase family enzyme